VAYAAIQDLDFDIVLTHVAPFKCQLTQRLISGGGSKAGAIEHFSLLL
jgi:hypothetical protein